MSPQALLGQVRAALAASYAVDLRGHADDTRRSIHQARVALLQAEDVLAHRAGETLTRGGSAPVEQASTAQPAPPAIRASSSYC